MSDLVPTRILRAFGPYAAGELAGFRRDEVEGRLRTLVEEVKAEPVVEVEGSTAAEDDPSATEDARPARRTRSGG